MLSKSASALALLGGIFCASTGYAADLGKSLKDTPEVEVYKKADFSGAYVGIALGGAMLEPDYGDDDFDGVVGEAVVGYDFRRASFVFGPRVRGGLSTQENDSETTEINGYVNLGGRGGLVFNRTLAYLSGGWEKKFIGGPGDDPSAVSVGLGAETKLFEDITFGGEIEHIQGIDDDDFKEWRLLGRINRHF